MSATHRVLYCDELLSHICSYATLFTLLNVRMTSKALEAIALRSMAAIVRGGICPFVGNVPEFFRLLEDMSGVVGGEVVLDIAVVNLPVRPLSAPVLSVFVPRGKAEAMRAVFFGWGYGRIPLEGYNKLDRGMYTVTGTS